MNSRNSLLLASVLTACSAVACGSASNMPMEGTAEDEVAIRALADRYASAYNAMDASGISTMAADNYQAVATDGTVINGKSGVENMLSTEMQMNQKMNLHPMLSVSTTYVHWLDADNATMGGTYTISGVPAGQPDRGSWLAVAHKSADGTWQLVSDLAAPHLEPPAAVPPATK